jgi:hypothetical protein
VVCTRDTILAHRHPSAGKVCAIATLRVGERQNLAETSGSGVIDSLLPANPLQSLHEGDIIEAVATVKQEML